MSRDTSHRRRDVIAEEAAVYLIELESPRPDTRARLATWLKTSPEHVEEFLAVAALWDALPDVSAQPSIEEVVELVASEANVVPLAASDPEPPRPKRPLGLRSRALGLAAAATMAAVLIGGALTLRQTPVDPNFHATAIGEQTSLPLPDGSLVTLNTQSALRVDYSSEFRDVHLRRGEALFDVAKQPGRPFRVITPHAVVTAVGTRFNVRSETEDVVVTVVEGIVDVAATSAGSQSRGTGRVPTQLTIGQQARVASQSGEVAVVEAAVDKATAWRERRLVFDSMSLAEVIDEFNRYNDPPLLIEDPALRAMEISGIFRANDRASFVAFLEQMTLAESETRADGTIVLREVGEP